MTTVRRRLLGKFLRMFSSSGNAEVLKGVHCEDSKKSERSAGRPYDLRKVRDFIPKLTPNLRKGQCGRIGVIGGSFEYTGAPYFAAISSLKLGVDLVHVFCCREAGPVIKSYSPELIVHPFLDSSNVVDEIQPWLSRLHALVIGPGMGRNPDLLTTVGQIITHCKENMKHPLPLIIDADGLFLITENLNLIKDYNGPLILTPNSIEFARLSEKMGEKDPVRIASSLNAVLLQKGQVDLITNGIHHKQFNCEPDEVTIMCDSPGSNRRCGGQGDVLSGCIATFVAWLQIFFNANPNFDFNSFKDKNDSKDEKKFFNDTFMRYSGAVYSACLLTRTCSKLSFEEKGRGMTASDMISHIYKAFRLHFGE